MNLSETAFLFAEGDAFTLRWFTPAVEIDLCGHATLASAHVLWHEGYLAPQREAVFSTRSGRLTARLLEESGAESIVLDFPATPASEIAPPADLIAALGVTPRWSGKTRFDYLLELPDEAAVRGLVPDFTALRRLAVRGVMVTARAAAGPYDFVSRFFAPGSGVDEDPVTGSAHCALAPYWAKRLGKTTLEAYQASERGGTLRVTVAGERVLLSGRAVTVWRGELSAEASR
jgi:PhzF family phenazine biosynthesis protein